MSPGAPSTDLLQIDDQLTDEERLIRDSVRAFVRDIATNHLPHIYSALHAIARKQGIEPHEPPLVRFVEFQGHTNRHHD